MTLDESKIIVTDDFLEEEQFERLSSFIMGTQMAWYNLSCSCGYPLQQHIFYSERKGPELFQGAPIVNSMFNHLDPVINKLGHAALIRIRANQSWHTSDDVMRQRDYHRDVPFDCTTGILYINDSDGCTIFENGDDPIECESKANRFIEFPSHYKHTSTPFTTPERRVVINFNYHKLHIELDETIIGSGTSPTEHW